MNLYKIIAAIAMVLALVGASLAVKEGTKELRFTGKLIKNPLIKVHVIKPFVKKATPPQSKSILETLGHSTIKEKQARALLQCVSYLTDNISFFGLFLSSGSLEHLERIYNKIASGHAQMYDYLEQQSAPRECAMAVHRFIRSHKISILPERALNLLCARNSGIPQRLVALDALNLLLHESSGVRWQFARAYLLMMQQLTLRGYLTPHEIRIVISPYLAVPAMFPGRSSLQNVASKSEALLEMFLNAHLLDDPGTLSEELSKETVKFRVRWRRMNPT